MSNTTNLPLPLPLPVPVYLPLEVIHLILLWLPVKSLIRFKCVSKSWFSLISNPKFSKSHFHNLPINIHNHNNRLLYIAKTDSDCEARSLDFNNTCCCSILHHSATSISVPIPYHPMITIRGSCRGFILLESLSLPHLIIWNPATAFEKRISYSDSTLSYLNRFSSRNLDNVWCGFGYDSSNDDYLIVIGWQDFRRQDFYNLLPDHPRNRLRNRNRNNNNNNAANNAAIALKTTHFEYFSVRTDAWKEIEGIPDDKYYPPRCNNKYGFGFLLNGAVHWLASLRQVGDAHNAAAAAADAAWDNGIINGAAAVWDNVILAFDFVARDLFEIPMPSDSLLTDSSRHNLFAMDGCLSGLFNYIGGGTQRRIYVMKEYRVESSWTESTLVTPHYIYKMLPLGYPDESGLVAKYRIRKHLVKLDHKGKGVQRRREKHSRRAMAMYTETLLSLPRHESADASENVEEWV